MRATTPVKTIALFDTLPNGHHPTYLKLFSQVLLEMGYRVFTFCAEPELIKAWIAQHHTKYASNLHVVKSTQPQVPTLPILGDIPRPVNALLQWQYAAGTIRNAFSQLDYVPDLVFFPWLDIYLSGYLFHPLIDRLFPYPWSGLFFHPPYLLTGEKTLPLLGTPLTPYSLTRSPRCRCIGLLDEFEVAKLQHTLDKPVISFPDLTDESLPDLTYPIATQIREKAGDRKVIGLLGGLAPRKGLLTLLEVAKQWQQDDWFFVFVGELYEVFLSSEEISEIRRFAQSNPSNCFFHLDWIPDEPKFNAVVESCDVLFAAYENFPYSSNMLAKAAVFEKLLIVSAGDCIGNRTEAFHLGISIPAGDVIQCIDALTKLHKQLEFKEPYFKPDFEGYRKIHSLDQLRLAFEAVCGHLN